MARHMMQRDMLHNDMADNHAAVSYYAGPSYLYWLQRTDTVSSIFIPKMFVERLRLSDGAAFHFTFPPIFQNQRRRKS